MPGPVRGPVPYRLPDLGEGMAEAEIVRWEVAVGDRVTRDQIVVVVQTDKAEVELPVPYAGTVTTLGADVGGVLVVGATLLELVPDVPITQPASTERVIPAPLTPVGGAKAAPPVRKLASELGVDLERVAGTGPDGRIVAADVHAAASGSGDSGGERRVPLRGIRRAMARNMAEAWRAVPHVSLFDEIDARPVLEALRVLREEVGSDTPTLTTLFVRASLHAIEAYPIVNASLDEATDEIVYHGSAHIGIAVAAQHGLVVPVVHDAGSFTLRSLAEEIHRLSMAARAGGLLPEVIHGATFTITNFGTVGGRFATPIVRPPQVAILGFGAIRVQPVVEGDHVVAAPALPLSLSVDHRVVDGHDATSFLDAVASQLRDPGRLLVDD
jgi:pyruvate/2-oxoglutarate dehydrogenase complex dihydrolipoamide acyltransferase (E2) component